MNAKAPVLVALLGAIFVSPAVLADPQRGLDEAEAAVLSGMSTGEDFLEDADQRASENADDGMARAKDARSMGRSHALEGIARGRDGYGSRAAGSGTSHTGSYGSAAGGRGSSPGGAASGRGQGGQKGRK